MPADYTEDMLCERFADAVKDQPDFAEWMLKRTKFAAYAGHVRLLHAEQMSIRPRTRWWRHWWCHVPELAKDRETDIFMVFQHLDDPSFRFAIHVENKKGTYRFSDGQAEAYEVRGRHMCRKAEYLDHSDFTTMIIAPDGFLHRFESQCALFEAAIAHEAIATFVPEFHHAVRDEG